MIKSIPIGLLFLCITLVGGYTVQHRVASDKFPLSTSRHIGVIVPLSGSLAEFGEAARNGILLAIQEYPERFESLKFIFEDSQYDPKTSISAFRRLAADKEMALIYNWGTATGEALAPIAEAQGVPLITNSQTPGISEHRKYVLRFINPAEDFSKALLASLRKRGYRRIGIVKTELAYINELLSGIERNLQSGETLEVVDVFEPSSQDFKSTITKLKIKNFDIIGNFLISGQISQFYHQASAQHLATPTFGSDFFESEEEIIKAGSGIEGAIYANILVSDEFREKYRRMFGNDTHLTYASNAYDFALLTAERFEKILVNAKNVEILASYQDVTALHGTSGTYGFIMTASKDKYFSFPVGVKEIHQGAIRVLSDT